MSSMVAEAPKAGWLIERLRALFARKPSKELVALTAATDKVGAAADKMIAVAGRIEKSAKRLDPLGDLVDGLREGPRQRTKKKKASRKRVQ